MTKKTAWSHLPNAAHIDRVIASVKTHPEAWAEAWNAAWDQARVAARVAARDAAWDAAWHATWDQARFAARDAAYNAALKSAYDTIAALIAYDDCAQYLDMPSDKLEVWAILSENLAAVLLLPAVVAFEKINELELA
jgi:hypothetical protein